MPPAKVTSYATPLPRKKDAVSPAPGTCCGLQLAAVLKLPDALVFQLMTAPAAGRAAPTAPAAAVQATTALESAYRLRHPRPPLRAARPRMLPPPRHKVLTWGVTLRAARAGGKGKMTKVKSTRDAGGDAAPPPPTRTPPRPL